MSISQKQQIISNNNITIAENVQKVYDAGKRAGMSESGGDNWYNTFWNAYQREKDGTERTNYKNAFYGLYWTEENLKPKYPIKIVGNGGQYAFEKCHFAPSPIS